MAQLFWKTNFTPLYGLNSSLTQLVLDLLLLIITAGAALLVTYIKKQIGTENLRRIQAELASKRELALVAVKFAEQAYKDFKGEEKYQRAAEWLAARSEDLGLAMSPDEIKAFIESALREIKDMFGENWANSSY